MVKSKKTKIINDKSLYGVLADEQSAATTTANLQAIGLEQDKLMQMTNAAIAKR